MLYLIVYLFDFYGRFIFSLYVLFVLSGLVGGISLLHALTYTEEGLYQGNDPYWIAQKISYERFRKALRVSIISAIIIGLTLVVLPSKKGLAMLGATYVGTKVYDSLSKSALAEKATKILDIELNNYLDQYIKEKEKKDETK